jgi:Reverse transcriptase (RNA-dependent DNA polymerase)
MNILLTSHLIRCMMFKMLMRFIVLTKTTVISEYHPLYSYEVETALSKVSKTAPGPDNIPYWVFKDCSFELADVVTHIFNCSLKSSIVPNQWRAAVITPVPKTSNPATLSNFRLISVTPILSRILERFVVTRWLQPAIPKDLISDQFAFRPTGSTTCALTHFMHHVTCLLETNKYVRCLLVDFSKAFDVVDHVVLIEKLAKLGGLPSFVHNWLISFLTGRSHTTKALGTLSGALPINLSIVQGSVIGPTLYIILESDLKPLSQLNKIFKYADDTNLIVPELTDVQLSEEFLSIQLWASTNKMIINNAKTKEIVFHRPNLRHCIFVPCIFGIELINEVKLLGVVFNDTLHFNSHVNYIIKSCSQRSYLLKKFRDQGLSPKQLSIVFDAIVLSRITYCICAWYGFLSQESIGRFDAFLKRMFSYGYCQQLYTLRELCGKHDKTLSHILINWQSCIYQLLPSVSNNNTNVQLRTRVHNFSLPQCKTLWFKNSFVNRYLFSNIY